MIFSNSNLTISLNIFRRKVCFQIRSQMFCTNFLRCNIHNNGHYFTNIQIKYPRSMSFNNFELEIMRKYYYLANISQIFSMKRYFYYWYIILVIDINRFLVYSYRVNYYLTLRNKVAKLANLCLHLHAHIFLEFS